MGKTNVTSRGIHRFLSGQRLRAFIVLSVVAHLALGLSWGVPAYLKSKRIAEEQRRTNALLEQQRAAAESALAKAKADSLNKTLSEVQQQTRKAFDKMVGDMASAAKSKLWDTVAKKVAPTELLLARALGNRTSTEQDLRNIQADLNRQLVQDVHDAMDDTVAQQEADAFLALVENAVAPELLRHYNELILPDVARPLHDEADRFVRSVGEQTRGVVNSSKPVVDRTTDQFRKLGDGIDAASRDADQSDGQTAENLKQSISQTNQISSAIDDMNTQLGILPGTTDARARLKRLATDVAKIRAILGTVSDSVRAGKPSDASPALTSASLLQRKLVSEWAAASDAVGESATTASDESRSVLYSVKDQPLGSTIQAEMTSAFHEKASDRLASVLTDVFRKRLLAANTKIVGNEELIAKVQQQVKQLLERKVAEDQTLSATGIRWVADFAGAAPGVENAEYASLTARYLAPAKELVKTGVLNVVSDTNEDDRLAALANTRQEDLAGDEARDRIDAMASNARDGRDSSVFGAADLTDLRAEALQRTTDAEQLNGTGEAIPTTLPADSDQNDPIVDDVKKDVLNSLHGEFNKLLDNKLTKGRGDALWAGVAKKVDGDVTRLSQDLIDPNVSDGELEQRRTAFSSKFLEQVRDGLDDTAANEMADALLEQLGNQTGDHLAEIYKAAVKQNVGDALHNEWQKGADAQRHSQDQAARDLHQALDETLQTTAKASEILQGVTDRTDHAIGDIKQGSSEKADAAMDANRRQLAQVSAAIADTNGDLRKATQQTPVQDKDLNDRMGDVTKALDKIGDDLAAAQQQPKAQTAGKNAEAFDAAVNKSRQDLNAAREAIQKGQNALDAVDAEAEARFIKAAGDLNNTTGKDGLKGQITEAFDDQFRKQAIPRLTKSLVNDYKKKLDIAAGGDDSKLETAIGAVLDKKITGDSTKIGNAAMGDMEGSGFFDRGRNAGGEPSQQVTAEVRSISNKVTAAGVSAAVKTDQVDSEVAEAVNNLPNVDPNILDLKDKVGRMLGQLGAGRGGLLADDDSQADADTGGVGSIRRKWRALLAGDGDTAGDDPTGKGGKLAHSEFGGNEGHAMFGPGGGPGGAGGPGAGAAGRPGRGRGTLVHFDEQQYAQLMERVKNRSAMKGETWRLQGSTGSVDPGDDGTDSLHPAMIVTPSTQPAAELQNQEPYKPSSQSLAFAAIPYLNHPITIDGDLSDWKDIPAIYLRPEKGDGSGLEGLHLLDQIPVKMAWDNHGLYFSVDMTDADNYIKKTSPPSFSAADVMEIFLDTMNVKEKQRAKGTGQQFWAWPFGSIDDAGIPGGESVKLHDGAFQTLTFTQSEMPLAAIKTDKGYTLEFRLPIERIRDADLYAGKILGLNVTIETGTKVHYYWSASKAVGTWDRPATWGDVLLAGSDAKLEIPQRLTNEDGPGDASKTANTFVIGEPLRLRVTDRDMNLNDKVKDKVSVTARNPRGETTVAILEETTPDSGVFEGSVRTALYIGDPTPGTVDAYEGETIDVVYLDQARANGARNTEIHYKIEAAGSLLVTAKAK